MTRPRFERAVLHVGLDKTGSTALQNTFDVNRERLASLGVCYPLGPWHAQLGSCFEPDPLRYVFNEMGGRTDVARIADEDAHYLRRLEASIAASSAGTQLVLSYEGFVNMSPAGLTRLSEYLRGHARTVQVLAYCRPPISYAASAAGQRVRSGLPPWDPTPYVPFAVFFKALVEVFGRDGIEARGFDRRRLTGGDVVHDVWAFLGLPDDQFGSLAPIDTEASNRSLSQEALLIGAQLIAQTTGRFATTGAFEASFLATLNGIEGVPIEVPAETRAELKQLCATHLVYMREQFGLDLNDLEVATAPSARPAWSDRSIASIARRFILAHCPETAADRDLRSDRLVIRRMALRDARAITCGDLVSFDVEFDAFEAIAQLEGGIHIHDASGRWVMGTNTTLQNQSMCLQGPGSFLLTHHLLAELPAGRYVAGFAFADRSAAPGVDLVWVQAAVGFDVLAASSSEVVGTVAPPVASRLVQLSSTAAAPPHDAEHPSNPT